METTNAIIFQEQEDGSYKGIEVNSNGQPSEVGRIIYYNYQKPTDVKSIIDNHYYVAKLGASGQVLENIDYRDQRRNALYTKDGMKFPKYTIVSMVRGYYTANKLQAIIDGNITEHNEESKMVENIHFKVRTITDFTIFKISMVSGMFWLERTKMYGKTNH